MRVAHVLVLASRCHLLTSHVMLLMLEALSIWLTLTWQTKLLTDFMKLIKQIKVVIELKLVDGVVIINSPRFIFLLHSLVLLDLLGVV